MTARLEAREFSRKTIREIRERIPGCSVEVLIPDFQGLEGPMKMVMEAQPDVLNHNTETVPRLYRQFARRALRTVAQSALENAKKCSDAMVTNSGVMLGLGETTDELVEVLRDLGGRGVDILTLGQYLRPSREHLPIARNWSPEESANCGARLCAAAFGTSKPDRWCAPAITRTSRPSPTSAPRAVS